MPMEVIFDEDGMTVCCESTEDRTRWVITRLPDAPADVIARALDLVPNPTGMRLDFPISGEFTTEYYCMN